MHLHLHENNFINILFIDFLNIFECLLPVIFHNTELLLKQIKENVSLTVTSTLLNTIITFDILHVTLSL